MTRLCLIGGTGFIGHHLTNLLISHNKEITVIGRNPVPSRNIPLGVHYYCGDYGDSYFMRGVLQGMDEVISLAHTTIPQTSFEDPVNDILSNLPAAVKLFEISADYGIKKLIFVSSGGTVYGKTSILPIEENHLQNPISPYGITKLAIEKYALMFNELRDLPVICVRPANAYGEGQKPFSGQGFVATAMASILNNREVIIFGENGTIRDYIYVTDVASGIVAALEHGVPGSCYNISSGVGRSNLEILDAIILLAKSAGLSPKFKNMPSRRYDVPYNVLNSSKLINESGWKNVVPFEVGMEKTWNWMITNR